MVIPIICDLDDKPHKKNMVMVAHRGTRTQKEMAELIGIPTSTYAMIESGHRFPRRELQKKLADFFGVTVDALFFSENSLG